MVKLVLYPSRGASRRRMRPHAEWKVRIQIERATPPSMSSSRSRISPAALFVNVIARISCGLTPTALSRCATRCVRTRVLPEPAPATTRSGPSVVRTASRCAGFRSERYVSGDWTATRAMLSPQPQIAAEGREAREAGDRLRHSVDGAVEGVTLRGGDEEDDEAETGGDDRREPPRLHADEAEVVEQVSRL